MFAHKSTCHKPNEMNKQKKTLSYLKFSSCHTAHKV